MRLKALIDEDFTNYKKPSMFIGTISCNWKCCKEQNLDVSMCQNSALAQSDMVELANEIIRSRNEANRIATTIENSLQNIENNEITRRYYEEITARNTSYLAWTAYKFNYKI